jgi:hypothetical protein
MLTYDLERASGRLNAHLADGSPFLKALADLVDWYTKFEDHFPKVAGGGQELPAVAGAMHGHLARTPKVTQSLDIDGFFESAANLHHLLADLLPDIDATSRLLEDLTALRRLFSTYIAHQSPQNALPLLVAARSFAQRLQAFQADLAGLSAIVGAQSSPEEDEEELSLIFDSFQSFRAFWEKLRAIDEIYADLCQLLEVEEKPLRISKIESGSEWVKLIGNAAVIGLLIKILYDAGRFVHRNYTREGRIAQTTQELKQVEALREVIAKFKKAKIEAGDAETQAGAAVQRISKNLNLMLSHESRFVVGDQHVPLDETELRMSTMRPLQLKRPDPPALDSSGSTDATLRQITDDRPKDS